MCLTGLINTNYDSLLTNVLVPCSAMRCLIILIKVTENFTLRPINFANNRLELCAPVHTSAQVGRGVILSCMYTFVMQLRYYGNYLWISPSELNLNYVLHNMWRILIFMIWYSDGRRSPSLFRQYAGKFSKRCSLYFYYYATSGLTRIKHNILWNSFLCCLVSSCKFHPNNNPIYNILVQHSLTSRLIYPILETNQDWL